MAFQRPRQMRRVAGRRTGGRGDGIRHCVKIFVVGAFHRGAVPVGAALGGDAVADIVEGLEQVGDNLVRPVLVADDRGDRDFASDGWLSGIVGVGQLRIQPFQCALSDSTYGPSTSVWPLPGCRRTAACLG